eukprot:2734762-Pleurochrysis_carterae.AAC.1
MKSRRQHQLLARRVVFHRAHGERHELKLGLDVLLVAVHSAQRKSCVRKCAASTDRCSIYAKRR